MKNLPIFRLFYQNKETIKLALPVFIELILGVLIGYINQFMFAGIPQATNAIGQVNQVTNIFIVSFTVLSSSSLIFITQLKGSNNNEGIPLTLSINLILGLLVCLLLISFFIFNLMNVDTQIIPLAKLYLYISAPSLIFYSLNQAYSSFLRANKKMVQPTIISFATNISNIIISAIVIWGIPDLSIEEKIIGIGFATLISRFISFLAAYLFFKISTKEKISLKELKPFPWNYLKNNLKRLTNSWRNTIL